MAGNLEFLCRDFGVKEPLGEVPKLNIKITIIKNLKTDLYVPPLIFDVNLLAIPPKGWTSSYKAEGWLETLASEPLFLGPGGPKQIEIYVPVNSQRLEKMLDIRHAGDLVGFEVFVKGLVFSCLPIDTGDRFALGGPVTISDKVMYNLPEGKIDRIVMTSEQFSNILEKLKHYELLRFEIPVREPKSSAQKDLNEALKLLHSAKDDLTHNNLESAMLSVRNALFNYLLQDKPNSTQQPPEKVLKEEIKDFVMSDVPSEAQEAYGKIVENLDIVLRRVRHILSRFIHEGSDKLKLAPLRQDVELSYFLTLFVVRRLSYQVD